MANIAIKIGVNAPEKDVQDVLKLFEFIYQQDESSEDAPLTFGAYAEDFSDGAIGVLASMSIIFDYLGKEGITKQYIGYVMQSFERSEENGKSCFNVVIPPLSRKLIRIVCEHRNKERNEAERSRFVQEMAEKLGFC